MLRPINEIIRNNVGNIIHRLSIVTGEVAADNGDGSYDVFIAGDPKAYPKIFTLARDPDIAVGDTVRILYKNGDKNNPIIWPPEKPTAPPELTLFESQLVNDGNSMKAYQAIWLAYFFQAESNHTIEKIQLYLTRTGSPYTITVSLFPNEGSGTFRPIINGGALTSGTTNGDTLPGSDGEWREIEVTSYSLISGTWYSIVVKARYGDISNYVKWWGTEENVKPNQWRHISLDSGVNWYEGVFDLTFKIYGN